MAHGLQQLIKIRRGKRTDIPALRTLLTPAVSQDIDITKQETRYWRRLAADLSLDFYVAEYADTSADKSPGMKPGMTSGTILGMVLVCYIRRLDYHGWCAVLDFAVSASAAERDAVGQALIDFAKTRARKRGCQQMLVHPSDADSPNKQALLQTLLTKNGFQAADTLFSCILS